MRCSCQVCDTYMVHSEGLELGCVCPECGYRCKACLGTDSVISRDSLRLIRDNPGLVRDFLAALDDPDEGAPLEDDDSKWGDEQWED